MDVSGKEHLMSVINRQFDEQQREVHRLQVIATKELAELRKLNMDSFDAQRVTAEKPAYNPGGSSLHWNTYNEATILFGHPPATISSNPSPEVTSSSQPTLDSVAPYTLGMTYRQCLRCYEMAQQTDKRIASSVTEPKSPLIRAGEQAWSMRLRELQQDAKVASAAKTCAATMTGWDPYGDE